MFDGLRLSSKSAIVFCGVLEFFKIENMTTANQLFDFFRPEERTQRTFFRYHSKTATKSCKLPTDTLVEQIVCVEFDKLTSIFKVNIATCAIFLISIK